MNFGIGLTLRDGNREYFYEQLDKLFPGLKERYIREYGNRYEVVSPNNAKLMEMFCERCDTHGIVRGNDEIFRYLQTFEEKQTAKQLSLWDL